jgi:hypothetical protein
MIGRSIVVLLAVLVALDVAFPPPSDNPVALCPKVEYRVKVRRGVEVRDTVTRIPEDCRW